MTFIKIILILIDVLACILLVGLILIQRSKSEGMGGLAMGAGMGEALFGSRAGNVLTRGTIVLACIFMGSTTLLAVLYSRSSSGDKSVISEQLQALPTAPAQQPAPMGGAPAPVAPAAPAPVAPIEATPASPVAAPPAAIPAAVPPAAPATP